MEALTQVLLDVRRPLISDGDTVLVIARYCFLAYSPCPSARLDVRFLLSVGCQYKNEDASREIQQQLPPMSQTKVGKVAPFPPLPGQPFPPSRNHPRWKGS